MFFKKYKNINNYRLEIPKDMEWCFDGNSYYEKNVQHWIGKLLDTSKSSVFYDIGANYGYYSISFCDKSRHIYAFEPVSKTHSILNANIRRNKITNVTLFKVGISNVEDEATIHLYSSSGNNSIYKRNIPPGHALIHTGTEIIQISRLDTLIQTNSLLPPDLLKIDVEGAELFVLQGAQDTIGKHRPCIILEYAQSTSNDAGYAAEEIIHYLTGSNYSILGLSDDPDDMTAYEEHAFPTFCVSNIIAIPTEKMSHANFLRF